MKKNNLLFVFLIIYATATYAEYNLLKFKNESHQFWGQDPALNIYPENKQLNIPVGCEIQIDIKTLKLKKIMEKSFILKNNEVPVKGKYYWKGTKFLFIPDNKLNYNTKYSYSFQTQKGADKKIKIDFFTVNEFYCIADTLINRFFEKITDDPYHLAYLANAIAIQKGWQETKVKELLEKVYSMADSLGGYGLPFAWDAFGDGTVNSKNTIYTVTLSDHVGMVFLEGYAAGVVSREKVEKIIKLLLRSPLADTLKNGICVAYSFDKNDKVGCVHNVNAGVGLFLKRAVKAGFDNSEIKEMIDQITKREVYSYIPDKKSWMYWDAGDRLNDNNHNGFQIEAMLELAPDIGYDAGSFYMNNRDKDWYSFVSYLRLLQYFPQHDTQILNQLKEFMRIENPDPYYYCVYSLWAAKYAEKLNKAFF